MHRSLRITVEYTLANFKNRTPLRLKKNYGQGWIVHHLNFENTLVVLEDRKRHKLALELHKSWCYLEFVNPLLFPAYFNLNGKPHMLKVGESLVHKQSNKTVIVSRSSNTKDQNYHILVRAD